MASVVYDRATRDFGAVVAVSELSLEIADGEFMVLVGPSGCGKTTALRLLAGLEPLTDGHIRIGDRIVDEMAPRERDIAMVFQDYALYPQMSVRQNLGFGLRIRKLGRAEIASRVERAAGLLGIEPLLERKPRELSGGQRQRVALGRALVRDPQVFLMDEPLSNLDAQLRTQTRGEIKRLQREIGTTTVYVTHDQVEAMTMGDRIAVMNDGVLEQVGTPEELYERPANRFVAGFIGSPAMSFFTAAAAAEDGAVRLRGEEIDLRLPGARELPGEVTVGVRPEAARLWRDGGGGLLGPLRGTVAYVEALGRETFVGVDVGDARLTLYEAGRSTLAPGDEVAFGLLADGLRFFSVAGPAVSGAGAERSVSQP
jgi:ABC-type sugar transport system ATPase subunit